MSKEAKVGSEELIKVKSHGRSLYVTIPGDLVSAMGIKPGDILRVKIQSLIRKAEE